MNKKVISKIISIVLVLAAIVAKVYEVIMIHKSVKRTNVIAKAIFETKATVDSIDDTIDDIEEDIDTMKFNNKNIKQSIKDINKTIESGNKYIRKSIDKVQDTTEDIFELTGYIHGTVNPDMVRLAMAANNNND